MVVSILRPSESLRDRSTPEERTQEEERVSLSLAHSSFLSSSLPPSHSPLNCLSLPFFLSIFRRLVGKPNTCVAKIKHSAVE